MSLIGQHVHEPPSPQLIVVAMGAKEDHSELPHRFTRRTGSDCSAANT